MNEILNQFPNSGINNSRSIVRRLLESMKLYPSASKAQKLENFVEGISVDYSPMDAGEEPLHGNYQVDVTNEEPC